HIPQRTCVGCRQVLSKKTLIRLVRTTEGIVIDPSGKIAGRGAYLHEIKECWEKGLKGPLANALKTELTETDRELLKSFLVNLPNEVKNTASESETDI
ncbi:MAG TPA: YlxR family protein, partial [Leptolinea sp.]